MGSALAVVGFRWRRAAAARGRPPAAASPAGQARPVAAPTMPDRPATPARWRAACAF